MPLRPSDADSGPVVELEFGFEDPEHPFVGASAAAECRVELEEMVPRGDGTYAEFYSVRGAAPSTVETMAKDPPSVSATMLERYDDGG